MPTVLLRYLLASTCSRVDMLRSVTLSVVPVGYGFSWWLKRRRDGKQARTRDDGDFFMCSAVAPTSTIGQKREWAGFPYLLGKLMSK